MSRPNIRYFEIFATIPNAVFIETGLYTGGGVVAAKNAGFKKIISIEPVFKFIEQCKLKFEREIENGRVELLHGSSETHLAVALHDLTRPICYWLDGHFQGEKEDEESNCPLDKELSLITNRKCRDYDVVLIDDLRLLRNKKAWQGHQLDIENLLGGLVEAFPRHVGLYVDGYVANDVFALIPAVLLPQVMNIRLLELEFQK